MSDPASREQIETSFRKGYYQGLKNTIEALSKGVNLFQLEQYFDGPLSEWRYHTGLALQVPIPPMPLPFEHHEHNTESSSSN
jgi:hypothetical protein